MTLNQSTARRITFLLILTIVFAAPAAFTQKGRLVRELVHGASLVKNVTGESPDRMVSIYLPASYETSVNKRYPVLYILHGIADTDDQWIKPWRQGDEWGTIQDLMDKGVAGGRFGEMIVVIPDEKTKMQGSFYTNSTATGNWEDFTTKDLVDYIDTKYRSLAQAEHRGLAGHSMGGYGAIKLGMKHPEVFSVVYGMSPALLGWARDISPANPAFTRVLTITPEQMMRFGFYVPSIICVAQAFSPDPSSPPFFARYPYKLAEGELRPAEPAFSQWEANMPLYMAKSYQSNLMKLRGLRFEAGYDDEFTHIPLATREFSERLQSLGIPHQYEEFNGDHRDRLWGHQGRLYTEVLPYFWELLKPTSN